MIRLSTGAVELAADELGALLLGNDLPPGGYIYFEVCDTGCGMTEEILFAPDGTSVGRTVWVSDIKDKAPFRIALFASTGRARVYEGW